MIILPGRSQGQDRGKVTHVTSASEFDVVIAGAGLVGAGFALAVRGSGLRVALLGPLSDPTDKPAGTSEKPAGTAADASADGWDRRIYAISPDSMRFLDTLGVWSQVDPARVQKLLSQVPPGITTLEQLKAAGIVPK